MGRKYDRISARGTGGLHTDDIGGVAVHVTDVSEGGVGVRARKAIRPGTAVAVFLFDSNGDLVAHKQGRVAHGRQVNEEQWAYGVAFDEAGGDDLSLWRTHYAQGGEACRA